MDDVGEAIMDSYGQELNFQFRILEAMGYSRIIIRNGKILERNAYTTIYNICLLIVMNMAAAYLMWFADLTAYLTSAEVVTIMEFAMYSNLLLLNVTFANKQDAVDFFRQITIIDIFLGATETKFMRITSIKFYKLTCFLLRVVQITVVSFMYYLFDVSLEIHIVGSIYFFWLIYSIDDFWYIAYFSVCLTTRTRYLNVALMRLTHMKMEYLPKQGLFNTFFWEDECDSLVTFQNRDVNQDFIIAFKMLFNQKRNLEKCFQFPSMLGIAITIVNTFVTVHTYVMFSVTATNFKRAGVITAFSVITWLCLLLMGMILDMFHRQIEQTKLICAYIQLKPTSSAENLQLTKTILRTLESRDPRINLYNMVKFSTGIVLQIAASTLVYVTVQLQLSFPDRHHSDNATNSPPLELNAETVKQYLLL